MSENRYGDAVIVAHDAPRSQEAALLAHGYRVLLVTARHTVYLAGESRRTSTSGDEPEQGKTRTVTVTRAATVLGISRSNAYEMVRTGALPAVRIGRRIVIPHAALDDLLRVPARGATA